MPRCVAVNCAEKATHKFPKTPHRRKLWEKAIKRKFFKATEHSRLCSKHFRNEDYETVSITTGLPQAHKFLKKNVVPSIFFWKKSPLACSARRKRHEVIQAKRALFQTLDMQEHDTQHCGESSDLVTTGNEEVPSMAYEIEIPYEESTSEDLINEPKCVSAATQTPNLNRLLSTEQLLSRDKSVLFYTGLESLDKFKLVFSTLLPMAHQLTYRTSQVINMTVEDQFLVMLIKLRRNMTNFELSQIFSVSESEISNIFVTWVNFVYELWSLIDIWPSRNLVDYYMPDSFKKNFKNTRVIIDGTEIPIMRPKNPAAQQASFSSYKHHNTAKFLVGASPGGLISYCSEGYAGATSDRQMVERSPLPNICDSGDIIMADRGFNIQDILAHKNIYLTIPTFLKGKSQLPVIKLQGDRKIAAQRIHIERLIGLTKTYKMLKDDVNQYYTPLLSRIYYICVILCNFRECIIKRTHF